MDRSIVLAKLVPGVLILLGCSITRPEAPTVAFFYGRPVPIKALSHYDYVVLEAENLPSLDAFGSNRPVIFAYLSIGECEWEAGGHWLPKYNARVLDGSVKKEKRAY
ncbi:hypothetical protein AB595_06595 [Massilia sp. WF1]|uniref:hypothetical protein n=1 Tax=Massilia sp. WF1 TaxID=1406431 RepID=UPI00064B36C6|nr:hypothetical protein [Massilia sp. WF1]KLU37646.1 hypothetical protein AB595_06595 [Massilia sp. WF1]